MIFNLDDKNLTIFTDDRIDAHNYLTVQDEILDMIEKYHPDTVTADCSSLTYIASAGLRVFLKIGKSVNKLKIVNVSRDVYEILSLTGFTGMFDTKRTIREISLDGCKIIGAGFSSNVYRYDRETVVKLFSERVSLDRIYSETSSAKKSFIAGIPTAIPYDIVKCKNSYGTVFELIDADTLSQNFMDHPEKFDEYMEKYIKLLKDFHSTPAIKGTFPEIRDKYYTWSNGLSKYMSDEEIEKLHRLIDAVPARQTMIHVDCHSRNIMVQDGKLIFVDMADVSIGHPLFDIGSEYFHYIIMRETSLGASVIFGCEPEDSELPVRVWRDLVRRYFAGHSESDMADINKMLKYFGCLRCLIMVAKHAHMSNETATELVNLQRENLLPNIEDAINLFSRADEFFD